MADKGAGGSKNASKVKGGLARARAMSPEKRSEIARKAAAARWSKSGEETVASLPVVDDAFEPSSEMPAARWRGALNIAGTDVPCYVLDTGEKLLDGTAVTELLTGVKGGGPLEGHLAGNALEPFVSADSVLREMVAFRLIEDDGSERVTKGMPADLMIGICNGFRLALQASLDPKSPHPRMSKRQRRIAVKAIAVLSACASVGLEGLIDEATGHQYEQYEASEAALRAKLGATLDEGLLAWEVAIPDELWTEFGRLTGRQAISQTRPRWWVRLVIEMIYDTLDRHIVEHLRNNRPDHGLNWQRQIKSDICVRALVSRCYEVIGMAKTCTNMRELRQRVALHHGHRMVLFAMSLPIPKPMA